MFFKPNESVDIVFLCEPLSQMLLMFKNTLLKVARYADINRTAFPRGKYVNVEIFHA